MCVCRCRLSTTGNYRRDILRWRERVEILIGLAGLVATVYIFWWKDWRKPTLTAEAKVAIEKMQSDSSQRGVFYFYDYDHDVRECGRTGLYLVCLHQPGLEIETGGRVLAELKANGLVESYALRMSQLPAKHQMAKDGFRLTDRGWKMELK